MCKTCSGVTFILEIQKDGKTNNLKGLRIRKKYGFK
jgi:hypothetical protein